VRKFDVDPKAWPKSDEKTPPVSWWQSIFKRPDLRSVGLEGQMTPMVGKVSPKTAPQTRQASSPTISCFKADGNRCAAWAIWPTTSKPTLARPSRSMSNALERSFRFPFCRAFRTRTT
jgi:hypothetical protein